MEKTRLEYAVGFPENTYMGAISRNVYAFSPDKDPYNPKVPITDLPNGGFVIDDLWPTGRYTWIDTITSNTTPYPHVLYTRCHQQKQRLYDAHSVYESRYARYVSAPERPGQMTVIVGGTNAVFYQSALWNYRQGTLYKPSSSRIQQALESALLNLWAGRPRQHMNVALALIELRDVKKTITQFSEFATFGIKVLKGQILLPAHIVSGVGLVNGARNSCRKVAEAYLWYTFGVRPTVDDILHFIKDVSTGRLVVGGRKRKPLLVGRTYANGFYAEPDTYTDPDGPVSNWTPYYSYSKGTMLGTYRGTPILHAEPKLPAWNRVGFTIRKVYGKVFAKVREQGKWTWKYFPSDFSYSCPLLRTAWELVPFSFVVDWFLNVGKSIKRLDDLSWVATTRFAFDEPWVSRVIEDTHYTLKSEAHADIEVSNIRWNGKSGQDWQMRADWIRRMQTDCWWCPERRIITYDRAPASDFGLTYASLWRGLIPEWQGKLKAYQISSGMALLESVFKLI